MSNMLTEVRLMNVPLEKDYIHTLYFENLEAQTSYFLVNTAANRRYTNLSYQRKDEYIRIPDQYDSLLRYNYVMYKNAAHSDKWYYAFITDIKYISDGRTDIYIETDVIQTWLFDYDVKESFIERQHVSDDYVGWHTVPEGLDVGEYIVTGKFINRDLEEISLILGCTLDINSYENQADDWNLTKEFKPDYGAQYDGLYSGLKYFKITPTKLKEVMKHIAYEGQEDAVHCLFYAPRNFIRLEEDEGKYATEIKAASSPFTDTWLCCGKPTMLGDPTYGYVPRNKKLLTSPYTYLLVDNGGGASAEYMFEKFDGDEVKFAINSTITPGMSIRLVPLNYNGVGENNAEGLNLAKYATCSWVSDAYTSWLTQSAINVGLTTAGAIASTVGAIALAPATAGGSILAGASITSGVLGIGSSLANANARISTPPQIHGNTNGGDVATANGNITFVAYRMTIRKEFAAILDGYFDMFGYKVNKVAYPLKNHRENYWYTKTKDVNIDGFIPAKDLQIIKDCYNKGITFWRNPTNIGKYSVSNLPNP